MINNEIENIFRKNKNIFLNREEEMKDYLSNYCGRTFERFEIEKVERIDATERIKVAGFHERLSSWRNYGEITLCSCEIVKGVQKRYDYKFIFVGELIDRGTKESSEIEGSRVKKGFKEFTYEERKEYREQKEKEKKEVEEDFQNFLKKQTIKDIFDLIGKSQEIPGIKQIESEEEIEGAVEKESFQEIEDSREIESFDQIHGYSIRNYLLVLSQARKRQEKEFVGIINSFWGWKKLGANVLKNPDKSKPYSYKILVPVTKKETGALLGFKLGSVFDISQTNRYKEYLNERKEEEKEFEWKDEIDSDQAIKFVKEKFPEITINEDIKDGDIRGSYDPESKVLTIHQKSSHTLFHELGNHIALSELKIGEMDDLGSNKNEILAEITCYLLMKKFEIVDEYKINYDFGYSNCWALDILEEFKFREFEKIYLTISDYVKNL